MPSRHIREIMATRLRSKRAHWNQASICRSSASSKSSASRSRARFAAAIWWRWTRGRPTAVVIGELKLTFTLELVLQAVDRTAACDEIWLAVRASRRGRGREADPRVKKLCRFLGLGLLSVFASGKVEVLVEPVPWRPRRDAKRRSKIVDEHRRRLGDPAAGGSTRQPIMTAYRQQALACAAALAHAPAPAARPEGHMPDAPKILLSNVYGWFVRVERGVYSLSDGGKAALVRWKAHLPPRPRTTSPIARPSRCQKKAGIVPVRTARSASARC